MNSLPSIDPQTVAQIKLALNAYGTDAEFLATFVEKIIQIRNGSGYGQITVTLEEKRVSAMTVKENIGYTPTMTKYLKNGPKGSLGSK